MTNNFVGGGGGYGTPGQYHSNDTNFGKTYGSTALTHLHGGSGGGGASNTGGGAGGGAISLEADGNGTLTIQSGATISANGGGIASTLSMQVVVDPVGLSDWQENQLPTTVPFRQKEVRLPPHLPPMTAESVVVAGLHSITRLT